MLAAACVAVLVGLFTWPTGSPMAALPAVGADGRTHLSTYPSSISKPPFIEESTRPGVSAALVQQDGDAADLYAVAPTGAVTRLTLPGDGRSALSPPALSPDGRWLASGVDLLDLVKGGGPTDRAAVAKLAEGRLSVQEAPWWSSDSSVTFVASANPGPPRSLGLTLHTNGSVGEVPDLGAGVLPLVAGWLDDDTILAFVPLGPGTSRLEGRTWSLGDTEWRVAEPDIEWQNDLAGTVRVALSPDRSRLLVTTQTGPDSSGDQDRTASTLVDTATGAVLGLLASDGSLPRQDPGSPTTIDWPGWGCRAGWVGQRPVKTDGGVRFAPGYLDNDLVSVSSRFGDSCVAFAGNELRGTPVANHLATWQERAWVWGGRLLVLLSVGGAIWWFTRGRSWREGSEPPRPSPPFVPQR